MKLLRENILDPSPELKLSNYGHVRDTNIKLSIPPDYSLYDKKDENEIRIKNLMKNIPYLKLNKKWKVRILPTSEFLIRFDIKNKNKNKIIHIVSDGKYWIITNRKKIKKINIRFSNILINEIDLFMKDI